MTPGWAAMAGLALTMSPLCLAGATPAFDAVSVKLIDGNLQGSHSDEHTNPKRLGMTANMHRFIIRAYNITDGQLSGEPDWFRTHLYAIDAVASTPADTKQMMFMLRGVLADRFQLALRQEERELPVYALEAAGGGPKFKALKEGQVPARQAEASGIFSQNFRTIEQLINSLNGVYGGRLTLDRPVVDRTHLTGDYNIQFRTTVDSQTDGAGRSTLQFPDLFHDIQSELGLKLTPVRTPMPCYVVAHASEPTPN